MQRRSNRGQKGAGRKAKGMRAGAGGKRRGTCKRTVTNRLKGLLFQQQKTASLNTPAEVGAQCVGA